ASPQCPAPLDRPGGGNWCHRCLPVLVVPALRDCRRTGRLGSLSRSGSAGHDRQAARHPSASAATSGTAADRACLVCRCEVGLTTCGFRRRLGFYQPRPSRSPSFRLSRYPHRRTIKAVVGDPDTGRNGVMLDTLIANLDAGTTQIEAAEIEALAGRLRGTVLLPDNAAYDEARSVWNAMIDRKPGLIVRCLGASDVVQAVRFAREHNLLLSVRGGGHNIAGNAVCDGGLLIDLSQ